MIKLIAHENETLDELLFRFKRSVNKSGILYDVSRHREFYKKSLKRKLKNKEAKKRRYY